MTLTEKNFYNLNKKDQVKILNELGYSLLKGLKEAELYHLYKTHFEQETFIEPKVNEVKQDIIEEIKPLSEVYKEEEPTQIGCPNCGSLEKFKRLKEWEYVCENCWHRYSGYPPPK